VFASIDSRTVANRIAERIFNRAGIFLNVKKLDVASRIIGKLTFGISSLIHSFSVTLQEECFLSGDFIQIGTYDIIQAISLLDCSLLTI